MIEKVSTYSVHYNKQRWGWMKKEVNPLILHVRSYFIKRIKELALQGIIDGIAL